jgi:hypothetical protein
MKRWRNALGDQVDDRDHQHHEDQHRQHPVVGVERDDAVQFLPDAARADEADDRRGAHVDLEAQHRVAEEVRHDLRHDPVGHLLEPVAADRRDPLDGPVRGVFVDLGKELAQRARRVDRDGQNPRQRPDPDHEHEDQRQQDLRHAAAEFEEPAREPVDPAEFGARLAAAGKLSAKATAVPISVAVIAIRIVSQISST